MPAKRKKSAKGTLGVMGWLLRVIAVTGFSFMVYLSSLHFGKEAGENSVCELGEGLSCEAVNTSQYSEVLGVPMAFLGLGFFALLFVVTFLFDKYKQKAWQGLFLFSLFVLIPSLYLTGLEILVIKSICIFCELSKLLMLIVLVLSGMRLHAMKKFPRLGTILIVLLVGVVAAFTTWKLQTRDTSEQDYTELAQCLTDNGLVMYGSFTCSVCARERQIFGKAFEHINEIECNPRGDNPQTELCLTKDISHTPTFTVEVDGEELGRVDGLQSPRELAEFTGGCEEVLEGLK